MKKSVINRFLTPIIIGVFSMSMLLCTNLHAQQVNPNNQSQAGLDEKQNREAMKKDGMTDAEIDRWEMQRKLMSQKDKSASQNNRLPGQLPVVYGACSDMGVENGWGGWLASTGNYSGNTTTGTITYNATGLAPATVAVGPNGLPRFVITTGAGVDPCTPGATAGSPALPVVAPGFGNSSIQLGAVQTTGSMGGCNRGCVEKLTYLLTVGPADTNFLYTYAILFNYPATGHTGAEVPFAEIDIYDALGNVIPCSHQKFMGDTTGQTTPTPGFYPTLAACTGGALASYKPWTTVGVNLSAYLGTTVKIEIINADCSQGGHYCYSYWDFMCPPLATSATPYCLGQQTTMTGPVSNLTSNNYTYQWYVNSHPYSPNNHWTIIPGAITQNYSVAAAAGDTFAVHVLQPSGCGFWIPYIPKLLNLNANFGLVNNCGTVTFSDSSTSNTGGGAINSWTWNMPGANPDTSTAQNPVVTYTTTGVHTVTLTVASLLGCSGTKTVTVTTGNPVAAFNTGPVCLGTATTFTNTATASSGDPISTYSWTFGDGNTSSSATPSNTYSAIGTYTVTQVVTTTAGCKDSTKMPVTVNAMPVAAFTSNTICAGNVTSLTDGSTAPVGQALTWSWTIPGGTPSTSTSQNPSVSFPTSGTYSVALTVTTPFGCTNTVIEPVMVNASPQAVFSSSTVCAGNVTSLTDASTPPPTGGAISGWSWTFANGNPATSTSQNPTVTFPAGTYNATVTVTAQNGCTNTVVHPVLVHGLPIAAFTFNAPCLGNPTNLNNTSSSAGNDPITSWSWNMTGGVPATSATQTATTTYSAPGTHTVTLTVITQGGCKDTISDTVRVHAPPVANFSGSGTGCLPLCVTNYTDLSLSTDGNIINSTWSFPGGSPSSSTVMNPPKVCYSAAGTYGASLVVTTSFGCIDSIKITPLVSVFAWPHADFCLSPDQAPATDPVFNFCPLWSPNPGVTSWVWDFGDGSPKDSGNSANNLNMTPVHSYSATATANDFYTFNICLKVKNQNGCWDSVCKTVELIPEFEFYISNSFTPNGDGTNDLFFGKGRGIKDYNIWVFDRWGNNIWDCSYSGKNTDWDNTNQDGMPSACKWDGAVVKGGMDMSGGSGNVVQQDVYVWKVKLTDVFDKNHTYVGRVSVIK